jgi:Coenzyme PQQ synthesis protein D (PqqD)
MTVRKRGDWLCAKVGDELVMMSAETGDYVGLSEVGARIWELLETPQKKEVLYSKMQEEYEVSPETCCADIDAFLDELERHGAIALDSPTAA